MAFEELRGNLFKIASILEVLHNIWQCGGCHQSSDFIE